MLKGGEGEVFLAKNVILSTSLIHLDMCGSHVFEESLLVDDS